MKSQVAVSDSQNWYAIDDLPAGRLRVRVRWEAREFVAARMVHPRTKRLAWCLPPRNPEDETVWLPRRADAKHWSPEPDCWQPENPQIWTWPNGEEPEPLSVQVHPQMYSGDGRRRWASMAEQAEKSERTQARIAAEVVAEFGPEVSPPAARKIGSRWWWDISLITHSPPGVVSIEDVEGRVCRAVLTDGISPGDLPQGWQGVGTALSQFVHEAVTSDDRVRFFEPTKRDLADYESFWPMRWFGALNPPLLRRRRALAGDLNAAQMIVVLHALGYSWRRAGKFPRLKVSGQRAMELYCGGKNNLGAIAKMHRAANGQPVLPGLPAGEDPLMALRRRNREARERGSVV